MIKPAPGQMLLFDSSVVTEQQMNAICANAIYIEACITIKKSSFKRLICPKLQYLKSCQEGDCVEFVVNLSAIIHTSSGRSAIVVMDNNEFEDFQLAPGCTFLTNYVPMHFEMNPRLPVALLDSIGKACPACSTNSDIGLIF